MSTNNNLRKVENSSHDMKMSYDEFFHEVLERSIKERKSPELVISEMAADVLKKGESVYISGSSFVSATNNPIDFLVSKILKVRFPKNENLLIGSAYHEALSHAFINKKEKGNYPTFRECYKEIKSSIDADYSFMSLEAKEKNSKKVLVKSAGRLFSVYYKEQMKNNVDVLSCEDFLKMPVPTSMLKYQRFYENITEDDISRRLILSGTPDLILYDSKKGMLTIIDHKTSANPISGKVEKNEKLKDFFAEKKELTNSISKLETQVNKFSHAKDKLDELNQELAEKILQIDDAKENKKPFKALENKKDKLERDIENWEEHYSNYISNTEILNTQKEELADLEEMILPIKEEYEAEKFKADLIECRNSHSNQLSFYALLFLITKSGKIGKINKIKLRIENVVKTSNPYIQVFEWDMDEREMDRAEELYQSVISMLELVLCGVEPLSMFKRAEKSFIGNEVNTMIDDINKIIYESEYESII